VVPQNIPYENLVKVEENSSETITSAPKLKSTISSLVQKNCAPVAVGMVIG